MTTTRITQKYFEHGLGYYISARHAAVAGFNPVCGLLAHYAVEMFLKGRLSVGRTEKELKDISHNLNTAWAAFKSEFPAEDLARFDASIADIDRFWHIRYPERLVAEGMIGSVDWSGVAGDHRPVPARLDPSSPGTPRYHLSLHDLDALVRKLFDLCSMNPAFFVAGLSDQALASLYLNNVFFAPDNIDAARPASA
jgi:hypothetical protein